MIDETTSDSQHNPRLRIGAGHSILTSLDFGGNAPLIRS
jgi:hypothetical protein